MEEHNNKPNEEVRVARSSEERIASMLLDSLENFNLYFNISLGIEEAQLSGGDFGGNVDKETVIRRASALIMSLNSLKQIIRIARPILCEIINLTKKDNAIDILQEIREEVNEILERISYANDSVSLNDDLILEKMTPIGNYAEYTYRLTKNFREVISDTEICYEEIYKIIFRNGLLTSLKPKEERRTKTNAIR